MKHLGWAFALLLFAAVGCKRADPKETQMAGEGPAPAAKQPSEPPIAAPNAGEERIAMPGDPAGIAVGEPAAGGVAGARDTSYAVSLDVPADAASGKEVVAKVKVTPGSGYKMNQEYPTKLTVQPTDGVTAAKAVLQKGDAAKFDNHELAFDVKLTPAKAGSYTVNGTLAFAVCTDATCDPKTEKIAINLVAK